MLNFYFLKNYLYCTTTLFYFSVIVSSMNSYGYHKFDGCYHFMNDVDMTDWFEFHSPNYPGNYPSNITCIRNIEAEEHYRILLDFRDIFQLEESDDCENDFLEIRDGQHGYSNLLGKFCGSKFPYLIHSTGRFLWLRFHSDQTANYAGFKGIYSFFKDEPIIENIPEAQCKLEITGYDGKIGIADLKTSFPEYFLSTKTHNLSIDCLWIITVDEDWHIQLKILDDFELRFPNNCSRNSLSIYGDRTDITSLREKYCSSMAEPVYSVGNVMRVRICLEQDAINSTFNGAFTAYKKRDGKSCDTDLFDCEDGACIATYLKCNEEINCRLKWDEDKSICEHEETIYDKLIDDPFMIAVMVVFIIILIGMCCACGYHCTKKIIHDKKIIQDQLRKSRESRLDDLGKKTPAGAVITPLATAIPPPNFKLRQVNKNEINYRRRSRSSSPVEESMVPFTNDSGSSETKSLVCISVEIQTQESLFGHSPSPPLPPPPPPLITPTFTTFGYDDVLEENTFPVLRPGSSGIVYEDILRAASI